MSSGWSYVYDIIFGFVLFSLAGISFFSPAFSKVPALGWIVGGAALLGTVLVFYNVVRKSRAQQPAQTTAVTTPTTTPLPPTPLTPSAAAPLPPVVTPTMSPQQVIDTPTAQQVTVAPSIFQPLLAPTPDQAFVAPPQQPLSPPQQPLLAPPQQPLLMPSQQPLLMPAQQPFVMPPQQPFVLPADEPFVADTNMFRPEIQAPPPMVAPTQRAPSKRVPRRRRQQEPAPQDTRPSEQQAAQSAGPASSSFIQQMLDSHNRRRAEIGTGVASHMPKPSTPLPPLTWDTELAQLAQSWSESMLAKDQLEHGGMNGRQLGQNVAMSSGRLQAPEEVMVGWYDEEIPDYNYQQNTCNPGKVCGHATQVIWRDSTQVGCGVAQRGSTQYVTCNFLKPGNFNNQRPY